MRITNNNTQYTPAFKQINLVQVSKKAFKNPEDLDECSSLFFNEIAKYIKTPSLKARTIMSLLGVHKYFLKYSTLLESPSTMYASGLTKAYNYCKEWFEANTGIKFKKPLCEDKHSFYVFTKEHQKKSADVTSRKNISKIHSQAIEEYYKQQAEGKNPSKFLPYLLQAQGLDKNIEKIINESEVHKFEIEDLSKISEIIGRMDF